MNSQSALLTKHSGYSREISRSLRFSVLAAIFLLAGVLRVNHINQPLVDAFSFRETSTAMMAENFSRGNWNIFLPQVNWAGPGPTYTGREFQTFTYLVGVIWAAVGQHDWIGRAVATAFGLTSLTFLYLLIRRIWGESYALAGAAVYAILPGAVLIDRSFLPDSVMLGLVVTSVWSYVVFLQTHRSGYLYAAMVLGTLGILTKLPGAVIIAPMVYATRALLTTTGQKSKLMSRTAILACLSVFSVVCYYVWAIHVANTYPPYHLAGSGNFIWSKHTESWFSAHYFVSEALSRFKGWLWTRPGILLFSAGLLESFAVIPLKRSRPERQGAPWLFHWWLAGCVLLYLIAAYELVWNSWNFHVFNIAAAAFAGRAVVLVSRMPWFGQSPAMTFLKASIPLIVLAWSSIAALQSFWKLPQKALQDYELGNVLFKISQPGDLVATVPSEMGDPRVIYYSHRHGWVFPDPYRDWSMLPPEGDSSIHALEKLRSENTRWLAIARTPLDRSQPPRTFWNYHQHFVKYIESTCERAASGSYGIVYRLGGPEKPANQ